MVGDHAATLAGIHLPDSAVHQIFHEGSIPKVATGIMPSGKATPVDNGYMLNGRWSFASGIRHSQWLNAGALVEMEGGKL